MTIDELMRALDPFPRDRRVLVIGPDGKLEDLRQVNIVETSVAIRPPDSPDRPPAVRRERVVVLNKAMP